MINLTIFQLVRSKITKKNVNKFLTDSLIVLFSKKLSYKNANEWIEKLLEISWDIAGNEWTEHKFSIKSDVFKIVRQEIAIQS